MLTWQSHASLSRAARGIHGCAASGAPTILQQTLYADEPAATRRAHRALDPYGVVVDNVKVSVFE